MTSPSYGVFGPSAYSEEGEVVLVGWNSEESIARLARASHQQDFYRLAHVFQPQINPLYCGIASAVIVLNGFRMPGGRAPSQSELEVVRPAELGGGLSSITSYSQLTLLDEKSDLVKPREVINMTRVADPDREGGGQFDGGLSIADLGKILAIYGANVTVTQADQDAPRLARRCSATLSEPFSTTRGKLPGRELPGIRHWNDQPGDTYPHWAPMMNRRTQCWCLM